MCGIFGGYNLSFNEAKKGIELIKRGNDGISIDKLNEDIIFTARRHAIKFSGNENVKLGVQIKPCRPTISLINVKRPLPLPSNLPKTLRSA